MEFQCLNKECEDFEKIEFVHKVSYKYTPEGCKSEQQKCPKCGVERIDLRDSVPLSEKNIIQLKIPSMNPQQKTAMLKKRSHEHFNSKIKERKEGLMGQAMKEMGSKK